MELEQLLQLLQQWSDALPDECQATGLPDTPFRIWFPSLGTRSFDNWLWLSKDFNLGAKGLILIAAISHHHWPVVNWFANENGALGDLARIALGGMRSEE